MWKTTTTSTFKILGKTLKKINPEASKKFDEAFKAVDEAFEKAEEAVDKATEAADSAFHSFSGESFDGDGNMQTEHMNVKVKEKSVTINGDVAEIILNGKKVYPA